MNPSLNEREIWIDNLKAIACVLVVVGHMLQGLIKSEIIFETPFYLWFETTTYYIHVPVFFFCAGYIHQKKQC